MRGEREIALTTPVSLTAFQPSLWDGSSLLRFQAFHAWLRSQVSTGQDPTGHPGLKSGYSVRPFHGQEDRPRPTALGTWQLAEGVDSSRLAIDGLALSWSGLPGKADRETKICFPSAEVLNH
jgi:hypothetical protein